MRDFLTGFSFRYSIDSDLSMCDATKAFQWSSPSALVGGVLAVKMSGISPK